MRESHCLAHASMSHVRAAKLLCIRSSPTLRLLDTVAPVTLLSHFNHSEILCYTDPTTTTTNSQASYSCLRHSLFVNHYCPTGSIVVFHRRLKQAPTERCPVSFPKAFRMQEWDSPSSHLPSLFVRNNTRLPWLFTPDRSPRIREAWFSSPTKRLASSVPRYG